jgi:hypothetical protein
MQDDLKRQKSWIDKRILFFINQHQSNQIGRIFAYWMIVYFGQCFEHYMCTEEAQIFGLLFPTVTVM